jgi:hypothetical protein
MKSSSAVESVKFHFFADSLAKLAGCAYSAISLLTGEDPNVLRKRYKDQAGMPPKVMLKHLKKLGFIVTEINKNYLYKLIHEGRYITDNHVVLASVRMNKKESSWVVLYGGNMWHNFSPISTSYVTSFSYPPEHVYMLFLPEWRSCAIDQIRLNQIRAIKTLRKRYNASSK